MNYPEIYESIPGTFLKYLEQKEIVKKVNFRRDFTANQICMGTEHNIDFNDFIKCLRDSIKVGFTSSNVTEVYPENLGDDITKEFRKQATTRAKRGNKLSTIIRFNTEYEKKGAPYWTRVNAYVYINIIEECEDNWFAANKYKFSYDLTIEFNGISINSNKAIKLNELIAKNNVANSIKEIKSRCP
ncbi:unnamed protein product [Rotaria sp. Silwood1]|nr:unnamed protein product [Rotaria sp. Silwood1]